MRKPARLLFKNIILTATIILALASICPAEIASIQETQQVADNWLTYMVLQKGSWAGSANPVADTPQDIIVNDTLVGRYVTIEPNGYLVIPILKEMPAIKACSDEYRLDFTEPGGIAAMIKEVLLDRVRLYVQGYGDLSKPQPDTGAVLLGREHKQGWDRLLVDSKTYKETITANKLTPMIELGPLLTTAWHQGSPYNLYCPNGDGGRCPVGCVATAAAQILAYYKWPPEGTGTHQYYWMGDQSCGGTSPGMVLAADYNDSYDWANIPDYCSPSCTPAQQAALAELNYEVGVAFNMDYGVCGSGAYTSDVLTVFPTYFRYFNHIHQYNRSSFGLQTWSDIMRTEIEASRPMQYRINLHSIVCDGWREAGTDTQVHMNYGWGGSNTTWYTIDNLYCPWEGCTPLVEQVYTNIEPDKGVALSADTTWGGIPLPVSFTGSSSLAVDTWTWSFGDGDSAFVQSPAHTYTARGRYDVSLKVTVGAENHTYTAAKYITILADSLIGDKVKQSPGQQVVVGIYGDNTVPLRTLKIPVVYDGTLDLQYDSFSTAGCRTDYFDHKSLISFDPIGKRMTFSFYNSSPTTSDLPAGSGTLLKLFLTLPPSAEQQQEAPVSLAGYGSYLPTFSGPVLTYTPILVPGMVSVIYVCGDPDNNDHVNILDVTYLINFLYRYGPPPLPMGAGDANGNGAVNVLDLSYLINYLYRSGPAPVCR